MPKEATVIFAGTFHRTMDAKNRVTVPSDWMEGKPDAFFLIPARDSLQVMPPAELAAKENDLRAMLPVTKVQEALRALYGSARRVEPDSQGRILIPEELCKRAELSGEVAFVGVKNRFEIWNPAKAPAATETSAISDEARNALAALGF